MSSKLSKRLEQLKREEDLLLTQVGQQGLIDPPSSRLRLERPGDRMLVMRFLCDVKRGGMNPREWARIHPAEFERLAEIFPRKHSEDR